MGRLRESSATFRAARAYTHAPRERARGPWRAHARAHTHTPRRARPSCARAACERGFSRYQMSSGHRFAFGGPICSIARETARARVHSDVRGRGHQVGCCFASPLLKESAKESHPPHPAWAVCVAATAPRGGLPARGSREHHAFAECSMPVEPLMSLLPGVCGRRL